MQVALISPPRLVKKLQRESQVDYFLPALYPQERYRNFFLKKRDKYTILEAGSSYGLKYSHSLALFTHTNEISFRESEIEPLPKKPSRYKYQLIVDDLELVDEYANSEDYSGIDVLGLPASLCDRDKEARVKFLEETDYHERFEFHCLGTSKWLNEVYYLQARSISTSYPVHMGLLNLKIERAKYRPRPDDYFEKDWEIHEKVYDNIRYYTRLARNE